MAKVMLMDLERDEDGNLIRVFKDVLDGSIDNLDDLIIEYGADNLIWVVDNTQSPMRFKVTEHRKFGLRSRTKAELVEQPNHPLHEAPLLNDWLNVNKLCASEISFKDGLIMDGNTWVGSLLEL